MLFISFSWLLSRCWSLEVQTRGPYRRLLLFRYMSLLRYCFLGFGNIFVRILHLYWLFRYWSAWLSKAGRGSLESGRYFQRSTTPDSILIHASLSGLGGRTILRCLRSADS